MSNNKNNDEYWINLIQTCRTSGLSDSQWCKDNGINPSTFYYNIKRLREKACIIPASTRSASPDRHEVVQIFERNPEELPEFNDYIAAPPVPENSTTAIRLDYHGIRIEITNSAGAPVIADTIRVLQKLC